MADKRITPQSEFLSQRALHLAARLADLIERTMNLYEEEIAQAESSAEARKAYTAAHAPDSTEREKKSARANAQTPHDAAYIQNQLDNAEALIDQQETELENCGAGGARRSAAEEGAPAGRTPGDTDTSRQPVGTTTIANIKTLIRCMESLLRSSERAYKLEKLPPPIKKVKPAHGPQYENPKWTPYCLSPFEYKYIYKATTTEQLLQYTDEYKEYHGITEEDEINDSLYLPERDPPLTDDDE